ncbi:unnamed protein product [Dibothriocephalus latus]|uniref:Uncharacterized protein n=1 Tax=Dibothriocephalus latus TaxID=60516 RepID=A0A3P6U232_DIBLA|nr:unnamed protein product [Dibothriocephalus latus]
MSLRSGFRGSDKKASPVDSPTDYKAETDTSPLNSTPTDKRQAADNVDPVFAGQPASKRSRKRNGDVCSCREAFYLFCSCTTVRGMCKLSKGPRFLRSAWSVFVVCTTCLLIVSVILLILDFLNYDVGVHTRLLLDDPSPFPAITVCHHYPFSNEARRLWKEGTILSPGRFNRYLRNLTLGYLLENDVSAAEAISFYDSLSVYYQNLDPADAKRLGHSYDIFLNCMRVGSHVSYFEDDCNTLNGYRIRQFSHHQYLNCHTFEPTDLAGSEETTFLSLIIGMGPKESSEDDEQAFLPDVFEQAKGLRVVVHEPGTYPDLEKFGLHAEPGKLNEIGYEPRRWTKKNTPRRPCQTFNASRGYLDLDQWYTYTHEQCLLLYQQKEIIEECGCHYVMNPRPSSPSNMTPYCGRMWPNLDINIFTKRLDCLRRKLDISVKRKYDGTVCLPRCEYYTYDTTISITKWRAKIWNLYWLRVQNRAVRLAEDFVKKHPNRSITESVGYKMWRNYLVQEDLQNIPEEARLNESVRPDHIVPLLSDSMSRFHLDNESFAYIILKRKSPNTIDNTEKLVLTLNVLASRIGGLCSVTIGITAAFVIEVVEFIYLLIQRRRAGEVTAAGEFQKNEEQEVHREEEEEAVAMGKDPSRLVWENGQAMELEPQFPDKRDLG